MHQQISKKIFLYFFLFILLGSLNNKEFSKFEFLKINEINVSGLTNQQNADLTKSLDYLKNKIIFFIDKNVIINILNTNKSIEKFSIIKKYPSSIDIDIIPTKYLANYNKDGKFFLIGSNGNLILSDNRKNNLPYVFGKIDNNVLLKFIDMIENSQLNYKEIKNLYYFDSGRWDLEMRSGILIRLPKNKLKESLNFSFKIMKNKKFDELKIIDLRQKNQVIINGS